MARPPAPGSAPAVDAGGQGVDVQDAGGQDVDVEAAGLRVEALLEAIGGADPAAQAAAEDLVRELLGLYGSALERLVGLIERVAPEAARALGEDPLLAGLLVLHGLHPLEVSERVEAAVAAFPGVAVASVTGEVVRIEVSGGCGCCAANGLPAGVEEAVRAAAPEIVRIETSAPEASPRNGLIPASALSSRPPVGAS